MNDELLVEIGDPSDWTGEWATLFPLDSSLRCGLCYVCLDVLTEGHISRTCRH